MSKIGGLWISTHNALPDESVSESYSANLLRPGQRPLGGKLYVTDHRVLFLPHRIDSWFGGEAALVSLADIEQVDAVTGSEAARIDDEVDLGAGDTDRLRIDLEADDPLYVIVGNPGQVVEEVLRQIEGAAYLNTEP